MIFCMWREFLKEEGNIINPHHIDNYLIKQKLQVSFDDQTIRNVSLFVAQFDVLVGNLQS